jgi:DNA-binding MarR family transcriptional regulator
MKKNEILDLETRRMIYNHILEHPGLHFRGLSRKMKIPRSTLDYHLNYMKKRGLITVSNHGKFIRFYVVENVGREEKKILEIIRQETPRRILLSMKIPNTVPFEYLIREMDKAPSTISYHMKKLIEADIVERVVVNNQVKFVLKDEDGLYDIFIRYNESLLDDFVNDLIEWITRIRTDVSFRDLIYFIQDTDGLINGFFEMFPNPYTA